MVAVYYGKNKLIGPMQFELYHARSKKAKIVKTVDLPDKSQQKIIIECPHGQRTIRFSRRHTKCKQCCINEGVYNTSPKGRKITWGDKISKIKKGTKFSDSHKAALAQARKKYLAKLASVPIEEYEYVTKGPQYKLRIFIMGALNRHKWHSSVSVQNTLIENNLGYSFDLLKSHLESQFQPGMTWDNYGKDGWEIDHVTPDSWFKYESINDDGFKKSWALDNLQPLWSTENKKKSNLYSGPYREKIIYMLCGQSGVGKSTVASKLTNLFTIIDSDKLNVKQRNKLVANNWFNDKPILLQVGIHISTTIKRYEKYGYTVIPFFIIETPEVVKERILGRGGSRTSNIAKRYTRVIKVASELSTYQSNADTMVKYLIEYAQKTIRDRYDSGVSN